MAKNLQIGASLSDMVDTVHYGTLKVMKSATATTDNGATNNLVLHNSQNGFIMADNMQYAKADAQYAVGAINNDGNKNMVSINSRLLVTGMASIVGDIYMEASSADDGFKLRVSPVKEVGALKVTSLPILNGTTYTSRGNATLKLGTDKTDSNPTENYCGKIELFGRGEYSVNLMAIGSNAAYNASNETITTNRNVYFPNINGILLVGGQSGGKYYGTSLPSTATEGQIFFKVTSSHVATMHIYEGSAWRQIQ